MSQTPRWVFGANCCKDKSFQTGRLGKQWSLQWSLTVLRRWSRWCSYFVWLCGLFYGALHVLKSSSALCPHVSSFLLALWSPHLGKRELVCVLHMHLFVLYMLVFVIFLFLLVSRVGCSLWLWHSLDFSINYFFQDPEQSDQGLHCLSFSLHHLDIYLYGKIPLFKFYDHYCIFYVSKYFIFLPHH